MLNKIQIKINKISTNLLINVEILILNKCDFLDKIIQSKKIKYRKEPSE